MDLKAQIEVTDMPEAWDYTVAFRLVQVDGQPPVLKVFAVPPVAAALREVIAHPPPMAEFMVRSWLAKYRVPLVS